MMSSMSGFITYINYVAGSNKGNVKQGDIFNNPFMLGDVDGNDPETLVGNGHTAQYTADRVTETFATSQQALGWTPVMQGTYTLADGTVLGDVKFTRGSTVKYGTFASKAAAENGTLASMTFKNADGTSDSDSFAPTANDKMYYVYDNVVIPQNDLPILNAKMESIPLLAKARRIAVYYSQIAAFQAKTDYGFDLGDQLAEKAVGQLSYKNLLVA